MPVTSRTQPLWILLFALGACTGFKADDTGDREDPDDESHDESDPLVSLDAPLDGETVTGIVSWSATASDNGRVTSVGFEVDGEPFELDLVEPWGGSWDSAGALNGEHVVSAVATDTAGNEGRASASVVVSNEGGLDPSAVVIDSPSDESSVCGTVDVSVTASAEVVQVVFSLDGEEVETDSSAPFVWSWDTTVTGEGAHTIMATGSNAEGEEGVDTVAVEVNNDEDVCDNPPSVSFEDPLDGETVRGVVEVDLDASDDEGVVSVVLYVDSGLLSTDTAVPYQTALTSTDFDDGPVVLRAVATDTSGQTGEAEITITIDNEAPEVEITTPEDGDTIQGEVSWSAAVSDNLGLDGVSFIIDGVPLDERSSEPYTVLFDATELAYGESELTVVAQDLAGNQTTETITVMVDNAPEVTYTSPTDTTVSGAVWVEAGATDDDGVRGMSLYVDGELVDSTTTEAAVSAEIDTCAYVYGSIIEVEAIASDTGGNITNEPLELTVDQPLGVAIEPLSGTSDYTSAVAASVGDDQSVSAVVWDVDGVAVATASTASSTSADCFECGCGLYTSSFSTASLSEGSHTLTVTATNSAGETASDSTTITVAYDHDGDGYDSEWYGGDDCDDGDPSFNPSAAEGCDGLDNDCDGEADEDFDADGDGYLDETLCPGVSGGTDCDDTDAEISPDGVEDCDGVDDDCDGHLDNAGGLTASSMSFGTAYSAAALTGTGGNVYTAKTNATITGFSAYLRPASSTFTVTWAVYVATSSTGDFTLVDSNTSTVAGATDWYSSGTFDVEMTAGYAYLLAVGTSAGLSRYTDPSPRLDSGGGLQAVGYLSTSGVAPTTISTDPSATALYIQRVATLVPDALDADIDSDEVSPYCGDCDDSDATVGPDATEICDDQDNDCDGTIDEAADIDGDGDEACTDCDDGEPAAYTGAVEICDAIDNDCDGTVDDDPSDGSTFYKDFDDDDYGRAGTTTRLCEDTTGWAAVSGDCDDGDATRSPGLSEGCDGVDNDCDSDIDEDFDSDGDGFGAGASCDADVRDCDDTDASINPDGTEICDSKDNDCDGTTDYGATDGSTYYTDADGDGYGVSTSSVKLCGATTGYSTLGTDCDDGSSSVNPGVTETCNEVDDDCDGATDDGFDSDGDGYASCSECDDADSDVNPGETETCENGVDDDCDGVDTWCRVSGTNDMGSTGTKLRGEAASDYAGRAVNAAGDQNGDGLADVLVGAYGNDEGGTGAGAAYIIPGGSVSASSLGGTPAIKLIGEDSGDAVGFSVGYVGDQDGDGYDDMMVGGYTIDDGGTDAGAGLMVMGPVSSDTDLARADARLYGEDASDYAGAGLGYAGDLNDDGEPDLWIGAPYADDSGSSSGTFYVVLGPTTSSMDLSTADLRLYGSVSDYLGFQAEPGDTNGDGYGDLLIGDAAYSSSDYGAAYVLLGPETGSGTASSKADARLSGLASTEYVGSSVVFADVDGDGYDDALVGGYGVTNTYSSAGAVYVVLGPVSASLTLRTGADFTLSGAATSAYFGYSASGGDLDKDGVDDVLIGAYNESDGGSSAGMAYVFYGPIDGSVTTASADASFVGEDSNDNLGYSVNIGGDIDGDSKPDLVLGAIGEDHTSGTASGSAYVIYP